MNFKKILLSTALSSVFAISSFATDLATYNGGKITEEEIMKDLKPIFENQPELKSKKFSDLDKAVRENLLKSYITNKLLEEDAKKRNIENSKDFKNKMNMIKKQLIQQELMSKIVAGIATEDKINKEYEDFKKKLKGQKEVKASHILVKTEKDALDIKKKLGNKGQNFAQIAKEASLDHGSKKNGGDLGYFMKGQMVAEFEKTAFGMKVGAISEPVKTQFGYHIIKLTDKRDAKIPSKEEMRKNLVNKLNQQAITNYVNNLEKKANIKFNF